jgi:hypothetical protein
MQGLRGSMRNRSGFQFRSSRDAEDVLPADEVERVDAGIEKQ